MLFSSISLFAVVRSSRAWRRRRRRRSYGESYSDALFWGDGVYGLPAWRRRRRRRYGESYSDALFWGYGVYGLPAWRRRRRSYGESYTERCCSGEMDCTCYSSQADRPPTHCRSTC